jgi:hypothetical protein
VVTRLVYRPCAQGTEVKADSIHGGPHEWPMNTSTKVNTSEEIWSFFKRFTLDGGTSAHQKTVLRRNTHISATYCSGSIHLEGVEENCRVRVIDTKGRLVAAVPARTHSFTFKNRPGIYMVMLSTQGSSSALKIVIP